MSKAVEMPQDLFELYAEFGMASENAQLLETEAGNAAICYYAMFVNTNEITDEQRKIFKALFDDVNRKTLGAALKHLKSIGTFDSALLKAIDEGLEKRNYLIHKFFRTHNFAIQNEEGRKAMIHELVEIRQSLYKTLGILTAVTKSLSQFAGIPEISAEELQNLIAAGRNKHV